MNDNQLATRISSLYVAATGVPGAPSMRFDAKMVSGQSQQYPWVITVGPYNTRGSDPTDALMKLGSVLENVIQTQRKALAANASALETALVV